MKTANPLSTAKALIKAAFERGEKLTTYTGNKVGHTVDFRKIVSVLRDEGFAISDSWETASDGRRFKVYFHTKAMPEAVRG